MRVSQSFCHLGRDLLLVRKIRSGIPIPQHSVGQCLRGKACRLELNLFRLERGVLLISTAMTAVGNLIMPQPQTERSARRDIPFECSKVVLQHRHCRQPKIRQWHCPVVMAWVFPCNLRHQRPIFSNQQRWHLLARHQPAPNLLPQISQSLCRIPPFPLRTSPAAVNPPISAGPPVSSFPTTQSMPGRADLLPIAPPQLDVGFATVGNSCCVSPPSNYVAAMGLGNCSSGGYQATPSQNYLATGPRTATPSQNASVVPSGLTPVTTPTARGVPKRPVINLGQNRNAVVVGQGLIGQPVAYVPGQCFRNWIRYIFP